MAVRRPGKSHLWIEFNVQFAGKVEAEPHLLPFWTVVVLVSRTWLVKNVQDGSRNNKYKQLQWPTAQAFTVAAVPETHWAQ